MTHAGLTGAGIFALALASAVVGACTYAPVDGSLERPDRATFPLVNDALGRRCATLDCHGSRERNLRLYGASGHRLDPASVPGVDDTTPAEYEASYRSVISLEPEVMSAVVADKGRDPERLSMVAKARGVQYHRPGAIIRKGDAADRCLISWLASAIDEEACLTAADYEAPPEPEEEEEAP